MRDAIVRRSGTSCIAGGDASRVALGVGVVFLLSADMTEVDMC